MSDNEEISDGLAALLGAILGVAVVTALLLWRGFALSMMWGWFMVPLGLPVIPIAHAIGVAALVSLLTHQRTSGKEKRGLSDTLFMPFVTTAITFGIAAIAHAFM